MCGAVTEIFRPDFHDASNSKSKPDGVERRYELKKTFMGCGGSALARGREQLATEQLTTERARLQYERLLLLQVQGLATGGGDAAAPNFNSYGVQLPLPVPSKPPTAMEALVNRVEQDAASHRAELDALRAAIGELHVLLLQHGDTARLPPVPLAPSPSIPIPELQVYIVHNRSDSGPAAALASRLRALGLRCWMDGPTAAAAELFREEAMAQAIKASSVVVAVLTPGVLSQPFALFELETAVEVGSRVVFVHDSPSGLANAEAAAGAEAEPPGFDWDAELAAAAPKPAVAALCRAGRAGSLPGGRRGPDWDRALPGLFAAAGFPEVPGLAAAATAAEMLALPVFVAHNVNTAALAAELAQDAARMQVVAARALELVRSATAGGGLELSELVAAGLDGMLQAIVALIGRASSAAVEATGGRAAIHAQLDALLVPGDAPPFEAFIYATADLGGSLFHYRPGLAATTEALVLTCHIMVVQGYGWKDVEWKPVVKHMSAGMNPKEREKVEFKTASMRWCAERLHPMMEMCSDTSAHWAMRLAARTQVVDGIACGHLGGAVPWSGDPTDVVACIQTILDSIVIEFGLCLDDAGGSVMPAVTALLLTGMLSLQKTLLALHRNVKVEGNDDFFREVGELALFSVGGVADVCIALHREFARAGEAAAATASQVMPIAAAVLQLACIGDATHASKEGWLGRAGPGAVLATLQFAVAHGARAPRALGYFKMEGRSAASVALLFGAYEGGDVTMPPEIIRSMVGTLKDCAFGRGHELLTNVAGCARELAMSDANLKQMVDAGILDAVSQILTVTKADMKGPTWDAYSVYDILKARHAVTGLLGNLCLSDETIDLVRDHPSCVPALRSAVNDREQKLSAQHQRLLLGLLAKFEQAGDPSPPRSRNTARISPPAPAPAQAASSVGPPDPALASSAAGHVMISYCWDDQAVVKRIRESLRRRNVSVWVDYEDMAGSVVDAMAEAIDDASVVLYGVSPSYKKSSNCRLEASYAHQCGVPMLPLMLEGEYRPRGWLGMFMGTGLWYGFFGAALESDAAFEKQMDGVCAAIYKHGVSMQAVA